MIDTLGTDPARRRAWRETAARHGVPCVVILFDVPAAVARRNNASRPDKRVPDAVIRQQLAAWPQVVQDVRAEPFAAVHVADDAALVPPAMVRRPRTTGRVTSTGGRQAGSTGATQPPLRFGLQLPAYTWPGGPAAIADQLVRIAQQAERQGIDDLWVMDHMLQIPMFGPPWLDMLESWTALSFVAGNTTTIRLGTLVTAVTYRNVAHLAKIVATLDVLSGGRAMCGIGLGWYEHEHRAYGWQFPTRRERYDVLADALQLLPVMWGPGSKPFRGRVLEVPDTSCYPRPLQERIPVLVGGSGERRTLRLVARHGDACNLFGEPDVVARKVAVLREHCAELDRDPAKISVSHLSTVLVGDDAAHVTRLVDATRPPRVSAERHRRAVNAGTVEHHVERVRRLIEAGVDHVIVSLADVADPEALDRWAAVTAAFR